MQDGRDRPRRFAASLGDRALARPTRRPTPEPPRWGGFFRSRHAAAEGYRRAADLRPKGNRIGHPAARGRRDRSDGVRPLPGRGPDHRRRPHREDRQGSLRPPVPGQPFDHRRGPPRAEGLPPARPQGLPRRVDLPRRRVDRGAEDPRRAGEEDAVRPRGPGRTVGEPRVGDVARALGLGGTRAEARRVHRRRHPDELRRRPRAGGAPAPFVQARPRRSAGPVRAGPAGHRTLAVRQRDPRRPVRVQRAGVGGSRHDHRPAPGGRPSQEPTRPRAARTRRAAHLRSLRPIRRALRSGRLAGDLWTSWQFADLVPEELRTGIEI